MSQRNSLKPSCDCAIDRALHHDENYIFITGAQKQSDSPSGKSYIAYHIRIGVNVISLGFNENSFLTLTHRILKRNEDIVNLNLLEKH